MQIAARISIVILLAFFLSGCSWLQTRERDVPEVKVITIERKLEIYQPPLPTEVRLEDVRWHVITRDNMEQKIAEIEGLLGGEFVVFAITPQAYEAMAWNMQELRRYIRQNKDIVLYYRRATQSEAGTSVEDWLQFNQAQQEAVQEEGR